MRFKAKTCILIGCRGSCLQCGAWSYKLQLCVLSLCQASEFWNLLYSLLRQIFPGEQDSSPSAHEKINLADRVTYVKSVLLIQGYGRLKFYLLPGDGEEGSREILLAFSWLLHRVKILEILLQKKRVQVGDHITICLCPPDVSAQKSEHISSSTKKEVDVRFLQCRNGKLRFCWRALHAARLEECAVLYKIHSYTQGCHIDKNTGHLSVMETELVRQPKSCAKLLQVMESEISYLEAYLEWKHVESVYWQWMDTVLESACEDEHGFSSQNMSKVVFTSTSQPQYKPTDMKVLSKCLRDTQDRLHKLAALGTSLSQEQIKEIEIELGKKELKKIKQEVRKLMGHCKVQVVEAKDIHGSYRLLLKEPKLHKSVNKDCSTNEVHVTQVTKHLQTVICTMEAESYQLQEQCRKRLDDITQELEGILCIPPAKG
ncbi:tubulin epsilon and delta complex protein 1 isoform X2 [Hyla sarda]|uniref:tubulin epsilon and delta complex protein 1 isoform X2 n=1 Tax=Hyla sarda TaxID=327740 RepID=UPI0024C31F7D|nr:tubulin epsilon and delta complex protein 1 isoform X2 [Hyla sarda]